MCEIVPFKSEHIVALRGRMQPMQSAQNAQCTPEFGAQMEALGNTWTAIADGHVIACAGMLQMWTGRAHLWAYLSKDAGRHMLAITRAVKQKIAERRFNRHEAEVAEGFEAAHRWVRLMGFQCETPNGMDAFFPDGTRGFLYSVVQ